MEQVIGFDSCIFIYLFEENPHYAKRAEVLLDKIQKGKVKGVFSSIGLIEILTGPKKQNRKELSMQYKNLITQFPHLTIRGINEGIVDIASDLRAQYGIATPDAIHLATAIEFGAQTFVTNDKKLQRVKEIKVKLL